MRATAYWDNSEVFMAALPDKEKLLRNFTRCASGKRNIYILMSWRQRFGGVKSPGSQSANTIHGCQGAGCGS